VKQLAKEGAKTPKQGKEIGGPSSGRSHPGENEKKSREKKPKRSGQRLPRQRAVMYCLNEQSSPERRREKSRRKETGKKNKKKSSTNGDPGVQGTGCS